METCHILPLAPQSYGKTTLVCSVMDALCRIVQGVDHISAALDEAGRKQVDATMQALRTARGDLAAPLLAPTNERAEYHVAVGGSASSLLGKLVSRKVGLDLVFHDYPGEWSRDSARFADKGLPLRTAEIVLVPVDATLLMEARADNEIVAAQSLHQMIALEDLLVEWNKGRALCGGGGLVIFVPMRCEPYFGDNGMQADPAEAERLSKLVYNYYFANVTTILTYFGEGINVLYAPVDTLGNVSLSSVTWDCRKPAFEARYTLTGERRPVGSELVALFILEYAIKLARQKSSTRTLEDMEQALGNLIDSFREQSGYNRALKL